jgi:hypothetical protein
VENSGKSGSGEDFAAYHDIGTIGTRPGRQFFSSKSEKVLQSALGRRVWVITSAGQKCTSSVVEMCGVLR